MINKIYLIQAHQYPDQLLRMINRLEDTDVVFYIHIDLKSDINLFTSVIKSDNIFFIEKRVDCIWGDFSQVQATLNLCEAAISRGCNIETRITLLSGQDYPIKSKNHHSSFLEHNKDISFINVEKIDKKRIQHLRNFKAFKINHSSKRLDFTLISKYHFKNIFKSLLNNKISLYDLKLLFQKKNMPLNMIPYRGSSWWSFNYSTLHKILVFYQKNKDILNNFYVNTFCPDENFFQTILMHLKEKDNTIKILPSLTYDNWVRQGVELPVTFRKEDLEELLSQPENKLFARKFDTSIDFEILNELDNI